MSEHNERRLTEDLQRRIQYQLNHTWLNLIDSSLKDQFLNNFSTEDKVAGLALLDMLLFHNQMQEKQLMRSLIRKMNSHIYKNKHPFQEDNSNEIYSFIAEEMKSASFIPVIDKNPADSSNAWSAILREITGTSDVFFDVGTLPLLISTHIKYIIFYDDMLGTGHQFDTFLKKDRFKINDKRALSIKDLMEKNPTIVYYYLCMAGHAEGITTIQTAYPKIHVIVSEIFNNEDSVLSEENEYWAYYGDKERDKIIEVLRKIIKEKNIDESFSRNLSVIFERNRPSNTAFPLYWYNKEWIPIKAREGS